MNENEKPNSTTRAAGAKPATGPVSDTEKADLDAGIAEREALFEESRRRAIERHKAWLNDARNDVIKVLQAVDTNFGLGDDPLDKLAVSIHDPSLTDWPTLEGGSPEKIKRRKRIVQAAAALLQEIEHTTPNDHAWLMLKMMAAMQPVRDLADQANRELEEIPRGIGRNAWKLAASAFYELVVQTWIEGGTPFYLGERRQFGIHPGGKATLAVKGLLALAGKTSISAETISDYLAKEGDPMPWPYEPAGADRSAHEKYLWMFGPGFRRPLPQEPKQEKKSSENNEKKKRGRPRGKQETRR